MNIKLNNLLPKIFAATAVSVASIAPIVSCNKTVVTHVTDVKFNQEFSYIENNNDRDFGAEVKVFPEQATDKSLTWSIENPTSPLLASVDEKTGVVRAGSDVGYATLRCVSNDNPEISTSQVIIIGKYVPVQYISIKDINLDHLSDPIKPEVKYFPSDATTHKYEFIDIKIADESIATYNEEDGKIKPVNVGETTYTVTPYDYDETQKQFVLQTDLAQTANIKVSYVPAEKIVLSPRSITLSPGATHDPLAHNVLPKGADQSVRWEIVDDHGTGSTIDPDTGVITAGNAEGYAYIKCICKSNENISVTANLSVSKPHVNINSIKIVDKPSFPLGIGIPWQPTLDIQPSNYTEGYYLKSSDNTVAICQPINNASGWQVIPLKKGQATITAISDSGAAIDTCDIKVEEVDIPVSKVTVKPSTITLSLYGSTKVPLDVKVEPEEAADKTIVWESSAPNIVSVDSKTGIITPHELTREGKPVTITARSVSTPDKYGTCAVTVIGVIEPVLSVDVNPKGQDIQIGQEATFEATVLPSTATLPYVIWNVEPKGIVQFTSSGENNSELTVKGLTQGTATITATTIEGTHSSTCQVNVDYNPVQSITMTDPKPDPSGDPYVMAIGETHPFLAKILPDTANQNIEWDSENPEVATVDPKTGLVTAINEGTSAIIAKTVGTDTQGTHKTAWIIVKVVKPQVRDLILNTDKLNLMMGLTTGQLAVTINPPCARDKTFKIEHSVPNIVECTINDNLIDVKPVSEGDTQLKIVSNDDPNVYATCDVVVGGVHVEVVRIENKPTDVYDCQAPIPINVYVGPKEAYNKNLIWTSTKPEIAYVDQKTQALVVKKASIQEVEITATSVDNPDVKDSFKIVPKYSHPNFADDSWSEVIKYAKDDVSEFMDHYNIDMEQNKVYPNTPIGLEKTIMINNKKHITRIIGDVHDMICDEQGQETRPASLTFELVTLLSNEKGNAITTAWDYASHGGDNYLNSVLRKNLTGKGTASGDFVWKQNALSMLPAELQAALKTVKKYVTVFNSNGPSITWYADKLFPLTMHEMNHKERYAQEEGETYNYYYSYTTPVSTQKRDVKGKNRTYWITTPSTYPTSSDPWCVYEDGKFNRYQAPSFKYSVGFAFCI